MSPVCFIFNSTVCLEMSPEIPCSGERSVGQVSGEATSGRRRIGAVSAMDAAPMAPQAAEADTASSWHQPPRGALLTVTDWNTKFFVYFFWLYRFFTRQNVCLIACAIKLDFSLVFRRALFRGNEEAV